MQRYFCIEVLGDFEPQDKALAKFIKSGATGNPNGDINLIVDCDDQDLKQLKIKYQGDTPNPQDPNGVWRKSKRS
jgi:hypothetical protein